MFKHPCMGAYPGHFGTSQVKTILNYLQLYKITMKPKYPDSEPTYIIRILVHFVLTVVTTACTEPRNCIILSNYQYVHDHCYQNTTGICISRTSYQFVMCIAKLYTSISAMMP